MVPIQASTSVVRELAIQHSTVKRCAPVPLKPFKILTAKASNGKVRSGLVDLVMANMDRDQTLRVGSAQCEIKFRPAASNSLPTYLGSYRYTCRCAICALFFSFICFILLTPEISPPLPPTGAERVISSAVFKVFWSRSAPKIIPAQAFFG
ncbi:hypothetical protein B0H63DRAFT_225761 [Podospora didyma]|uniref:Uncharacterized protein n=1 Tax=Podospora didyma TaxID=330526 RepID=A0AAE0KK98_9PEZI|nr:hypothetical protein B0H63DRAFT_225761 [Podospora didyma]